MGDATIEADLDRLYGLPLGEARADKRFRAAADDLVRADRHVANVLRKLTQSSRAPPPQPRRARGTSRPSAGRTE